MEDVSKSRDPPSSPWRLFLVVSIVCILAVVKYHPLLSSHKTRPSHDWFEIHQQDAVQLVAAMKEGDLFPFWSRWIQGGTALFAVPTKPFTYLPFLAAVSRLGPYLGMNLLTLLHIMLGGIGMVLLVLRFGGGFLAALVGALFFLLTKHPGVLFIAAPFWGYAIAWWPFVFLCVLDLLDGRRILWPGVFLGLLFSLQLHAGGIIQIHWLLCFTGAFLVSFLIRLDPLPCLKRLALGGGVALLVFLVLSAIKLLPVLEWVKTTGRAGALAHDQIFFGYERDLAEFKGTPRALAILSMMVERRGSGYTILSLCFLAGLITCWKKRRLWAVLAGSFFCLVLASGVFHHFFYEVLPGYNRMRMPYRFSSPAGIGLILTAAFGVDALWKRIARRDHLRPRTACGVLLVLAILVDAKALPFVRFATWPFMSDHVRRRMARPVFASLLAEKEPFRFHYPVPGEQAIWIPLNLESTTGLLGGEGSANHAYEQWLPFHARPEMIERTRRGVLDVLNTRYIASLSPMNLPHLTPVYAPEPPEYKKIPDRPDAFVACVTAGGGSFDYCGYFGGSGLDVGYGIAADAHGRAHFTGYTTSTEETFPLVSALDSTHNGDADAFVATLSPDGRRVEASTFLGGNALDWGLDIEVNDRFDGYVVGQSGSSSATFPVLHGPLLKYAGGERDAFVAKLRAFPDPRKTRASSPARSGKTVRRNRPEPLPIIENRGQVLGDAKFYVQGAGRVIFFEPRGITYVLVVDKEGWSIKFDFVGCSADASPHGSFPLSATFNYFRGPPEKWITDVRSFARIEYPALWPGVDLTYLTSNNRIKSRFFIHPGTDPDVIRFACRGARTLEITDEGALMIHTVCGVIEDEPPRAFQEESGNWVERKVSYRLLEGEEDGAHCYGFALEAYDPSKPIVIDPSVLLYGGYLGGAWADMGKSVAVDSDGCAYVSGQTFSTRLSCPDRASPPAIPVKNDADAFVAKVGPPGTPLLYYSILGGRQGDFSQCMDVDDTGHAYITGSTRSDETTFPVKRGPDPTFNGEEDAYVAKLGPDGNTLIYCGYIGGTVGDYGQGIAVDKEGNAFVTGDTKSTEESFPVCAGPDLTHNGGPEAFVAKVDADGKSLDFCGYIGGNKVDVAFDIDLDRRGGIYITGLTSSKEDTFPVTRGPDLTYNGGKSDAFVAMVHPEGSHLVYCGYIGGDDTDMGYSVAVDPEDRALVTGTTLSKEATFPVKKGPFLAFNRNPYKIYLKACTSMDRNMNIKPFIRPYLYKRKTCLPRISLVHDAVLVVGDEPHRTEAVRKAITRPDFHARTQVFIEQPTLPAEGTGYRSIVFAGMEPDDPPVVAWSRKMKGGRIVLEPGMGTVWTRAENWKKGSRPVIPVEGDRFHKGINRFAIDLQGIEAPFLLLSEVLPLHPGWRLEVDGRPTEFLRADGLITALRLTPGARKAVFRFTPPGFTKGAWITGISLAAALLLGLLCAARHGWRITKK